MSRQLGLLMFASLLLGCGSQTDQHPLRGGGKADNQLNKTLSCEGACGDAAIAENGDYCFCDGECADYDDCCNDKVAVCDATADPIEITEDMNGSTRTISVGDTIDVQLHGNPTTGFAWHLFASSRSFPLQDEEYIADEPQLTGSGGTYHFYFTADMFSAGNTFELQFDYYRSWEGIEAAEKTFTIKIAVQPTTEQCEAIDLAYQAELEQAKACSEDSQCQTFVGGNLACGFSSVAINTANQTQIEGFEAQWSSVGCGELMWNCPLLAPAASLPPPWLVLKGFCKEGTCTSEYVDTRAGEGQDCGEDIDVQCADGLYCAFGLNWCGTPPVVGVCRQMGDCGAPSDCINTANDWPHISCMGEPTCSDEGKCGWECGSFPIP